MTVHREDKTCPRCGMRFECSAGSPRPCQCASVTLSPEESEYILGEGRRVPPGRALMPGF
ncbi:MAG: cysteine-rich CWC family protein [Gammaproteobacteria bacterium]